MALSRFNKFLVYKGYAKYETSTGEFQMKSMVDLKKITREFEKNEKMIKQYYVLKNKGETDTYKFFQLKKSLIFY